MEKDDELYGASGTSYDFGARLYDPRVGRWLSMDPLVHKYPSHAPYVFAASNPILYLDSDGREIEISTTFKIDGTKVVSIVITGKMIDESTKGHTYEELGIMKERLVASLIEKYSVNEPGIETNVTVNIDVGQSADLTPSDHAFRIVDRGSIPDGEGWFADESTTGRAAFGQNYVYISEHILDRVQAVEGKFAGTGKTVDGLATLERTGPHELGHSAQLRHPDPETMDGNLMHQTRQRNAGQKLTKEQIREMQNSYNNDELNQGEQDCTTPP